MTPCALDVSLRIPVVRPHNHPVYNNLGRGIVAVSDKGKLSLNLGLPVSPWDPSLVHRPPMRLPLGVEIPVTPAEADSGGWMMVDEVTIRRQGSHIGLLARNQELLRDGHGSNDLVPLLLLLGEDLLRHPLLVLSATPHPHGVAEDPDRIRMRSRSSEDVAQHLNAAGVAVVWGLRRPTPVMPFLLVVGFILG